MMSWVGTQNPTLEIEQFFLLVFSCKNSEINLGSWYPEPETIFGSGYPNPSMNKWLKWIVDWKWIAWICKNILQINLAGLGGWNLHIVTIHLSHLYMIHPILLSWAAHRSSLLLSRQMPFYGVNLRSNSMTGGQQVLSII